MAGVTEALEARLHLAATIAGYLFADNDANGRWDNADTRNVGWTVFVDANNNGALDLGERTAVTNLNGHYAISGLSPGSHVVRELLQFGWRRTCPATTDRHVLNVADGTTAHASFGNAPPTPVGSARISGTLFADYNANGMWDAGDGRNAGWRVYLDANNNGAFDAASETGVLSDANGNFTFAQLPAGVYRVREVVPAGWRRTQPLFTDVVTITLAAGQVAPMFAFGNAPVVTGTARVTGTLFNDVNANGAWDAPDGRNAGWRVYIDADNDAVFDTGEISTLTDANGSFVLGGLPAGTYTVREVLQPGWRQTSPVNRDHFVVTLAAGQTGGAGWGNTQAISSISGSAFNDANGNGVRDLGEAPLPNWAVYVDANNNSRDDYGERWVATDAQGNFSFTGLPAGSYRIRFIDRYGWNVTAGVQSYVATVDGRISMGGYAFGARQLPEPASYSADRVVSWILIGDSSPHDADRRVGWNIEAQGWTGFVQRHVQPQIAWGARRFLLHNPFGTLAGEVYQADQALHARAAGLDWLLDDFVAAWQPVIAQGIEVIAYLGMPRNDPSFAALDDAAWWDRFWQSLELPMDAGMSIALDMSLAASPGSRDWNAVQALRDGGTKVYGEPRPSESLVHWHSAPLIAEDSIWKLTDPEVNPNPLHHTAKDSQITGDVLRLISRAPDGHTHDDVDVWGPSHVRSILREGHDAGLNLHNLIERGVTLEDLLITGT